MICAMIQEVRPRRTSNVLGVVGVVVLVGVVVDASPPHPRLSVNTVISDGANTRNGGPQYPVPRLT